MRVSRHAVLMFFLLVFCHSYFYQYPSPNGNTRLALTMAIVKQGRLNIDSFNSEEGGYATIDYAVYEGRMYTDKAIGSSIIPAVVYYPIYKVLGWFGVTLRVSLEKHLLTLLVLGLPSAIGGTLIYILCDYVSRSRVQAFLVTAAVVLGTMSFPFSLNFFGHQLAAVLLFSAFFLTFRLKTLPEPVRVHWFICFSIGLLMGLAFITEMTSAFIVLPLIGYYFYCLWKKNLLRRAGAWIAPFIGGLIPLAVMIWYNMAVYGHLFASGYQYEADSYFRESMAEGLMGIGMPNLKVLFYETMHPAQGIFWQSPVLLLIFAGALVMLREKQMRVELLVASIAFTACLVANSGYYMWWGGWSFGVRHVIPMLPFLCLPLVFVPRKGRLLLILLTALSVFQMTIPAGSRVVVSDEPLRNIASLGYLQYSTIYSNCTQLWTVNRVAWNPARDLLGWNQWVSLLPFVLILAAFTAGFFLMKPSCGKGVSPKNETPGGWRGGSQIRRKHPV